MGAGKDPTKDPEFQKVVDAFLRTPPKPHKPTSKAKPIAKPKGTVRPRRAK